MNLKKKGQESREMVVKIRLQRFGRRNLPFYRIAVMDARKRRDGRAKEYVSDF